MSEFTDRLCNKTEYTRSKGGRLRPNNREEWLDVQARALYQAEKIILTKIKEIKK